MTFTRIFLAWVAASLVLLGWGLLRERVAGRAADSGARWQRPGPRVYLGEATLLVLLAALWFGSLGHGGWLLLFLLVGLLLEWRAVWTEGREAWSAGRRSLELAGGAARTMLVGGVLSWILP